MLAKWGVLVYCSCSISPASRWSWIARDLTKLFTFSKVSVNLERWNRENEQRVKLDLYLPFRIGVEVGALLKSFVNRGLFLRKLLLVSVVVDQS